MADDLYGHRNTVTNVHTNYTIVDDDASEVVEQPRAPTLSELVERWEDAKVQAASAAFSHASTEVILSAAVAEQKAAYKAMNEAIDALRPKRAPKKPLVTHDGTKIEVAK